MGQSPGYTKPSLGGDPMAASRTVPAVEQAVWRRSVPMPASYATITSATSVQPTGRSGRKVGVGAPIFFVPAVARARAHPARPAVAPTAQVGAWVGAPPRAPAA